MDGTLTSLLALMRLTLTDSMEAGRRVKELDMPVSALWEAFALVIVLSVLLTELASLASPTPGMLEAMRAVPLLAGLLQALFLFVMVHATYRIGVAFGGEGSFEDSLKLIVWLQAMLVAIQVVQVAAFLVLPPLAPLIGIAAVAWFFWVLTSFVMVLHGFDNRARVFLGILASFLIIVFALSVVLSSLGLVVVPGAA